MRKRIVHILLLLLCTASTALCQSVNDTILIDMVTITPFERITPSGEKVDSFDSLSLKAATYKNIGEFLAHNSNVIIKNYGTEGMTSSLSLRGAGNSRTQILWEGLSLNAISNGENNLSLVPISCFDNITINYGASATNFGNGTFGGAINLKSTPLFKKHASAHVFASYGSFKTYKTNVGYSVGTEKIQYKGDFFYSQSESDFEYFDYIRLETLKRKNADYFKYGTIQ
nr:TonB-dependent receptor plug domain-containing protein [Bacteroidales bacterium]